MTFRNATLNDLAIINEIENLCFPPNEAATSETLAKRLQVFPQHFWLIEDQNNTIGFINGMITDNRTIVDEMFKNVDLHNENGKWQSVFGLATSPNFQKKGYAGELIKHLIAKSKSQNRKGITLTCKDYLVAYYEKFGFIDQGISASVYGGEVWHDMVIEF
ncbi:GNAT family N-acetyltransferase [Flavobacterium branchiicola]|uniref:GNAT family N-acetyltransferase n=1 Tax=Flavobacterium branchiicola TaxID=1114875 RepID=A0ABV9P8Q6_9FLAO|nr:N-acetyltransferase [Flavobacterium branchiicola]MBS7253542.1 GNAT family N-acetyltransferase [Flavobacterium branchiicola]